MSAEVKESVGNSVFELTQQDPFDRLGLMSEFKNLTATRSGMQSEPESLSFASCDPLAKTGASEAEAMSAEPSDRGQAEENKPTTLIDLARLYWDRMVARNAQEERERREDFTNRFGADLADQLISMGCNKIDINGNKVSMEFSSESKIPIGQYGFKSVNIGKNLKFEVSRNGDSVEIKNIEGVHIDHRASYFDLPMPDIKLNPDGSAKTSLGTFPVHGGVLDRIKDVMKKQGL